MKAPPRRVWFLAALMVSSLTINACIAEPSQSESTPHDLVFEDLGTFLGSMGYDVGEPPLSEIVADDRLDLVEYEAVANDVVTCMRSQGIEATTQYSDVLGSSGYEFTLDLPDGMDHPTLESTMSDCERETRFEAVATVWAFMVGPTPGEADEIDRLTEQCLVDAGVEGGRSEAVADPLAVDIFLSCHADATAKVLGGE